jgi:hypothetical protein
MQQWDEEQSRGRHRFGMRLGRSSRLGSMRHLCHCERSQAIASQPDVEMAHLHPVHPARRGGARDDR